MAISLRKTPKGVVIGGGTAMALVLVGLTIKGTTNTIPYDEFNAYRNGIIQIFAQKVGKLGKYDIQYDFKNKKVQVQLILPLDTAKFRPNTWSRDSTEYANSVRAVLNETLIENGLTKEHGWKIEGVGTVRKEESIDLGAIIKGPAPFTRLFHSLFKKIERDETTSMPWKEHKDPFAVNKTQEFEPICGN